VFVGNGFGKFIGATQIEELGEIETPILLTSTLNVWRVADALTDWMLALEGNADVLSINPVVGETNDGALNDIRARPVGRDEVFAALRGARGGPVEEGAVGAGTGTIAFGWKGGIGTASRRTPGGWTTGALVQTNYGGDLRIGGVPAGRLPRPPAASTPGGSVIVVLATDAPVDARNLKRLAARAMLGLGRTGAAGSNGSGDYAVAFSTGRTDRPSLANAAMSELFLAAIEATEEAVVNSLFMAETVEGNGRRAEALPVEQVLKLLRAQPPEPAPGPR
jgi:D-aminopeptidase